MEGNILYVKDLFDEHGLFKNTQCFDGAIQTKTNWIFEEVISPEHYSKYVKEWIERGINLVGGCCGITTEHIKYVSEHNF